MSRIIRLLQLRIRGFRFLGDGNAGVGVFPGGEEVFTRRAELIADGGVFGSVEGVSASQPKAG